VFILHICLISVEIFAWGKYGGFGRATRILGRELSNLGIQVTAIVPQRNDQKPVEILDGMRVLGFKPGDFTGMLKLFRETNADVYHSQEPSLGTYLVQKFHPEKKHVVTCRDTRLFSDWLIEFKLPSLNKLQVLSNWLYEDNLLVQHAVRHADRCFIAAQLLKDRVQKKYHLSAPPEFLPTPVQIPATVTKNKKPTICYVARWDRRKQPEVFFELAKSFPDINFIAAGYSRDKKWDAELRDRYGNLENVILSGFVNQFDNDNLSNILSQSWILVNTAAREGLPTSFIEAAAHHCAILSAVDPDGYASNFGYHVQDGNFKAGLTTLLNNNFWQNQAEKGYENVKHTFALEKSIQRHLNHYRALLQ
jgi:glycosyltransferase involved in cell wall biosynthesis